jgi:Mn-dependent DtxR family transcriptional regulator
MQNKSQVWKEFNKNELTHSTAHYLMTIYELLQSQGYARLSDVALKLKITKGSLSTSLKPLIKKGLILEDENKHLSLSAIGEELAISIENTYSVVEKFLHEILGVSHKQAKIDACKIEHLISDKTSTALMCLYKGLNGNPELRLQLQAEVSKYKNCTIKGCKSCKKEKFCLNNKSND